MIFNRNSDLTPFLDARQNQLQLEVATGEGVDTKGLGVLAANLALAVFIGQATNLNYYDWKTVGLVSTLGVSFILIVIAIWPRKYAGASVSLYDHPEYADFSSKKLVKQLIGDTEDAIFKNQKINKRRL